MARFPVSTSNELAIYAALELSKNSWLLAIQAQGVLRRQRRVPARRHRPEPQTSRQTRRHTSATHPESCVIAMPERQKHRPSRQNRPGINRRRKQKVRYGKKWAL